MYIENEKKLLPFFKNRPLNKNNIVRKTIIIRLILLHYTNFFFFLIKQLFHYKN